MDERLRAAIRNLRTSPDIGTAETLLRMYQRLHPVPYSDYFSSYSQEVLNFGETRPAGPRATSWTSNQIVSVKPDILLPDRLLNEDGNLDIRIILDARDLWLAFEFEFDYSVPNPGGDLGRERTTCQINYRYEFWPEENDCVHAASGREGEARANRSGDRGGAAEFRAALGSYSIYSYRVLTDEEINATPHGRALFEMVYSFAEEWLSANSGAIVNGAHLRAYQIVEREYDKISSALEAYQNQINNFLDVTQELFEED